MSDYSKWGKAYYETNKAAILEAEKEKKRWLDYYQKNKEVIAERNRRRYYERKGLPVPEKVQRVKKERVKTPVPDTAMVDRFEKLVEELRSLVPQVVKPKRTRKAKAPVESPVPVQPEDVIRLVVTEVPAPI